MPDPKASLAAAQAAGLATPQPSDFIHRGDDAITLNARFTTDALTAAATADANAAQALTEAAGAEARVLANPRVPQPLPVTEVAFTITDETGMASWVEVGTDGRPSAASRAILADALGTPATTELPGVVYSITDPTDVEALAVLEDGTVAVGRLLVGGAPVGDASLTTSRPEVACYGDSLTWGGGAGYPARLAALLGVPVANHGVSSQSPSQIAARQGARPALVTVTGSVIPQSGAVAVTSSVGLLQGVVPEVGITGTLAGVHGRINGGTSVAYTFTRTAPGRQIHVPTAAAFIPDEGTADRDRTQVLWPGRNNPGAAASYAHDMIRHLTPASPRFLLLSQINGTTEPAGNATHATITNYNTAMLAEYGDRFLDVRTWLVNQAIHDLGITPTTADLDNMAADAPPPSVMADTIHPIPAVYTAIGDLIHARFIEKGWA